MALAVVAAAIFIQAQALFTRRACVALAFLLIVQPLLVCTLAMPDSSELANQVHQRAFQLLVGITALVWLFTFYLDREFDSALLADNIQEIENLRYKFKKA
jgi:hypothetical protein